MQMSCHHHAACCHTALLQLLLHAHPPCCTTHSLANTSGPLLVTHKKQTPITHLLTSPAKTLNPQ
jgi:hypothetical protein